MEWRFEIVCGNDSDSLLLLEEPIDWDSYTLITSRDPTYHGKLHEFSTKVGFWGQAYRFIRDKYRLYGAELIITLSASLSCSDSQTVVLPRFRLNISSLTFEDGNCICWASFEDHDCAMTLKNRSDLPISLNSLVSIGGVELDPYLGLNRELVIPPRAILKNNHLTISADTQQEKSLLIFVPSAATIYSTFLRQYIKIGYDNALLSEIEKTDISFVSYDTEQEVTPLLSIQEEGDFSIDLAVSVFVRVGAFSEGNAVVLTGVGAPAGFSHYLFRIVLDISGTKIYLHTTVLDQTFSPTSSCSTPDSWMEEAYNVTHSAVYHLKVGDTIKLYAEIIFGSDALTNQTTSSVQYVMCVKTTFPASTDAHLNYFKASILSMSTPTPCTVFLVNEALARVVESITDKCLTFYSSYFGRPDAKPYNKGHPSAPIDTYGCGSLLAITNGLLVRRIAQAECHVSLRTLLESLNAIHCLGMEIEENPYSQGTYRVRVEKREYFYRRGALPIYIDSPVDFKRSVDLDMFFSKLTVGYSKWEAEAYNGLDEFATKRTYTTSLTVVEKEVQLVSSLIASGYALEITRRQPRGTKDWRYDKDIFLLSLKYQDGEYVVDQGEIQEVSNLIHPESVINYSLSPVRNVLRWSRFLFSIFKDHTADTAKLLFVSGEGNYKASGYLLTDCSPEIYSAVSEDSDISYFLLKNATDNPPILTPEKWTFSYPLSFSQWKLIRENFYMLLPVKVADGPYEYGYIDQLEWTPSSGMATFSLTKSVNVCEGGIGCMAVGVNFVVG